MISNVSELTIDEIGTLEGFTEPHKVGDHITNPYYELEHLK